MKIIFLAALVLFMMLMTTIISAQDKQIKGRVLDANSGEGIPAATIIINQAMVQLILTDILAYK